MSLFSPLTIRSLTLKNRIGVSPMCQYSSHDGFANDWHLVHLGSRAVGGAALVMTEATAVEDIGRISPEDLGIWKDDHVEFLARITRFIHDHGAMSAMQLAHAGRKASTWRPWSGQGALTADKGGWTPVAPSAEKFADNYLQPVALSENDIARIARAFGTAARRAREAGFKILELHAAHGYLLHEFLSPLSNHRNDRYGGSLENRARAVFEVAREIRREWPESLPLFIRISATDWVDNGWDVEQAVWLCEKLKAEGVDLVDVSSGGNIAHAKIPVAPGYQVPFAEQIKKRSGILSGAVGLITESAQANHIVESSQADVVFLARQLLRDPYWPLHAAREMGIDVEWPAQYLRAK